MKHIYYKNDFAVEITLLNASGEVVAPPDWQWHIEFTDGRRKYICSVDKGNAKVVGNTIMCYLDNHKFCCGEIGYKFVQAIPDLNYLDGFQNLITPKALPIELWEQESDNDINIQSSVVPAYVVYDAYMTAKANGYTGTAEEFYDALNHIVYINKKEAERVEAEANRVTAEQQRVENFTAMESALTTATNKANTATSKAEEASKRADNSATSASQAATQATTATKRANDISADLEAKREADYWRGAKGDKGEKGDTGAKGDRGEKGDQGERGLQGVQGVKGDDGVSPTVTTSKTGNVTTIEITDANGVHTATVNDGESVEVVQSTGTNTTAVMSQKAVSDNLSEMDGKVDELEVEINGGTTTIIIEASSSTNGLYVNATHDGYISGGSSSSAIAFYPIEKGKQYHVIIPKTGNSATFVFSFSSSIISSGQVSSHLDIIGNSEQLESDIIAPMDGYLIVDYSYQEGIPTVTTNTGLRGIIGDINAINQDLVSINGKVDDNKQDLSNIKKDLYGIVIDKEIDAASSTNGLYVNATHDGYISGGSSSSAIAFYPIEKDKTYHVEIPKVGNTATYVFSFADTIMDSGRVPHHLDMIGNSQPLSIDIVAPNYAYLIIGYAYASGMPVVTNKVEESRVFAKLTDIPQAPESKKSLKILYFGNSFTQDSVGYMPFILKGIDENIELTVGIAYTGGASLQRHCANILNQAIGNVSPSNYTYYNKYTNGAEKWISSSNVSAATILSDEDWDVVTFQQSSDLAASEFNTYIAPYIYKIEHYLSSYFHTKPVKTGWLLTQSRGNDSASRLSNYNGVAVTARKVMELTSSAFLIPYGTAVQNLRSIPSLDALGVGGGMSYDGQHLQEGIGCLVAAYTHTLVCLQLLGIENRSILGENTRPNSSWIIDKAIPLPNWDDSHTVIGITDNNCYLAQMAANLAIKKMFEVTDMSGFVE